MGVNGHGGPRTGVLQVLFARKGHGTVVLSYLATTHIITATPVVAYQLSSSVHMVAGGEYLYFLT